MPGRDKPKYLVVEDYLRDAITSGTIPVGSRLPTESKLMDQFNVSRAVITRVMNTLQTEGWVRGEQGSGRIALGPPEPAGPEGHGVALAKTPELVDGDPDDIAVTIEILSAGEVAAPPPVAFALGVKPGSRVLERVRLVSNEETGPVELSRTYLAVDLALGTDLASPKPLGVSVVDHLRTRRGLGWGMADEVISARLPSAEEAEVFGIGARDVLLAVSVTLNDVEDTPRVVIETTIPAQRQVLSDRYPI